MNNFNEVGFYRGEFPDLYDVEARNGLLYCAGSSGGLYIIRNDLQSSNQNIALGKPVTITTNGADDGNIGQGEWPEDVTDGDLSYEPASSHQEDGVIGFVNNDYNQLMEITVKINLGDTYQISRIRYNQGNVQHGESWTADIMESPFGSVTTQPGGNYSGAWTEQTGNIEASEITITFKKTRTSAATDWLFIGEVEVYGNPIKDFILYDSGFKLNRDGYNFDNDRTLINLTVTIKELYQEHASVLSYIWPFLRSLGRFYSSQGNCYGMSASSIMYYHSKYLIPQPFLFTHEIEPWSQEATDNIAYYQRSQIANILSHFLDRLTQLSNEQKYNTVINDISIGKPLLLSMKGAKINNSEEVGHAIVAYKIKEFKDSANIFVYDANFHDDSTRYVTYIRENEGGKFLDYMSGSNNEYYGNNYYFYNLDSDIIPIDQFIKMLKEVGSNFINDLIQRTKSFFIFSKESMGNFNLNRSKLILDDDIYIEDKFSNKTGFFNGMLLNQIPGATIIDTIFLTLELDNNQTYNFHHGSSDNNPINFAGIITSSISQSAISYSFDSISVFSGSSLTHEFSPDRIGPAYIDLNGDGIIDTVIQPSNNILVSTSEHISNIPTNFSLLQNYPNPFNPSTTISYSIPSLNFVTLKVYDVLGKEVITLVNEEKPAGNYEINFNASGLSSGIYFYRMQAGSFTNTKKFIFTK